MLVSSCPSSSANLSLIYRHLRLSLRCIAGPPAFDETSSPLRLFSRIKRSYARGPKIFGKLEELDRVIVGPHCPVRKAFACCAIGDRCGVMLDDPSALRIWNA